ncbi:tripartite tricarboxylate transporter permease [Telmatospirillum sp. J64-1]|uniref:tripartite tricarboxylate transporter permease n=1 Tax=Telmatospirillum sp. J64-1 TaxID=2502183 RepID=UPI00115EB02A|nr:tripartite tricarboxylate transporter permease [Telmatospirillum sp. J64-1]
MGILDNLALGFSVALSTKALLFCFIGVTLGTFVGVLPGVGSMAAISMLLPLTFYLEPMVALVMLAGIYYGSQYGGSTAAILLNLPGSATSAITCIDGYPMAQKGRAGVALCITTIASFFGGSVAIVLLSAFAPGLSRMALSFGPAEYFSMMMLGLVAASSLSLGSPLKSIAMVVFGLLLGIIGTDIETGQYRFVFNTPYLYDGLSIVALAMGLFGVAEIIANLAQQGRGAPSVRKISWRSLLPSREDLRASRMPMLRGTAVGSGLGILPGTGSAISTVIAYAVERKVAKDPSRFGKGAIEGVVAPESANNAAAQAAFIPTLTLGIPGDVVMALMLGAFMIHGITPGPQLIVNHPDVFWGLVASFWIGNLLLVILNLPLVGIWVKVLSIPYHILYPSVLFFICIGVYSINNNPFDIMVVLVFGIVGYLMRVGNFPMAPLLLGFILGPLLEENLRRTLILSRGDLMILLERPVSAGMLAAASLLLLFTLLSMIRKERRGKGLPA